MTHCDSAILCVLRIAGVWYGVCACLFLLYCTLQYGPLGLIESPRASLASLVWPYWLWKEITFFVRWRARR